MKPYAYLYDIIHDRLNKIIAKNVGKVIRLDFAKTPKGWDADKWLYYINVNGIAAENSFKEGDYGAATGKLAGGLNNASNGVIDASQAQEIVYYTQLLDWIDTHCGNLVGMTPQRMGQVSNRETVGGVERATLQSSHSTEWLFFTHDSVKRRVLETANDIGLPEELLERSPFELSGGQKRRVAIAGVMAMEPRVLVLDEPAAGLDPAGRELIFSHIRAYHRRTGNTTLIVSHSMEDVASFADRILVMNEGKVFCFDETEKVFARAEEITQIGLDVPQITKVFMELKRRGFDFGREVFTVESARELLLSRLSERKGL